jgi:hypothetical protein
LQWTLLVIGSAASLAANVAVAEPSAMGSYAAARRIDLPPFLIDLLGEVMDSHGHEQVFASPTGRWLRRSNFDRRIWRPVCDGDPARGWSPLITGAVFHGLRHFHRTLLDETDHPDVLVHERMGHQMPGIGGCAARKYNRDVDLQVCGLVYAASYSLMRPPRTGLRLIRLPRDR